jgi:hypothetical protein
MIARSSLRERVLTRLAQVGQMRLQADGYSAAARLHVSAKLLGVRRAGVLPTGNFVSQPNPTGTHRRYAGQFSAKNLGEIFPI